eukprot:1162046-Pelagomonas_calceolata.AAC.11
MCTQTWEGCKVSGAHACGVSDARSSKRVCVPRLGGVKREQQLRKEGSKGDQGRGAAGPRNRGATAVVLLWSERTETDKRRQQVQLGLTLVEPQL